METLRILWLNWRCIKHPLAGGAEVYTHEVARRLARQGHEVVLITSRPEGLPREEVIDGYRVVRDGGKYTVYLRARRLYRRLRKGGFRPDVVIDEVNTIPFLTPLYVEEPIVMLIHQLCRDCWSYTIHPLIQPLGWWLERVLHKVYVGSVMNGGLNTVVTVSESTKQDLIELGYPEGIIRIVPNGLDWNLYGDCMELCREKDDLVVYVGRVTPYKRLEDALRAWKLVEQEHRHAKLVIAGRADPKYLRRLKELARRLELRNVSLIINVPSKEKKELLARAKALIYTSVREGWGQTVLEAAACKTPTIAYNVPGLRDSVKHMKTGILVKPRSIRQLAKSIMRLLGDEDLRSRLAENAYTYVKSFSWDRTAKEFLEVIKVA